MTLPRLLRSALLFVALLGGLPARAQAADAPPALPVDPSSAPAPKPNEVVVGVYLSQIYGLNLRENSFSCDFYVWFRWKGHDDYKPLETFELTNGRIDSKTLIETKKTGDVNYACARVVATVVQFFDLRRFPVDSHVLTLEIEDDKDAENDLKFVNDAENTGVDPRVKVRGYAIRKASSEVLSHTYRTNYGDDSLPIGNASSYSQYLFSVDLVRPGAGFLLKLYWSVFLSTVIALLAFRVKPNDLDPRFGLGVGAIFACAASTYVIAGYLPDTDYLTLADKLSFLAVTFIFGSIAQSTVALRLFVTGREKLSEKLDTWSFWGSLALYAGMNVFFITTA